MDDILVLRIENCNDFYVNISGSYLRSCFGISLEELLCLQQAVRSTRPPASPGAVALQSGTGEQSQSPTSQPEYASAPGARLSVPKEVWRLVDALCNGGGITEADLFIEDAAAEEVGMAVCGYLLVVICADAVD